MTKTIQLTYIAEPSPNLFTVSGFKDGLDLILILLVEQLQPGLQRLGVVDPVDGPLVI